MVSRLGWEPLNGGLMYVDNVADREQIPYLWSRLRSHLLSH